MPELPEVERARKLLEQTCVGRTIKEVIVREDTIVFVGGQGAHEKFKSEVEGRKVEGAARKGKVFWLELAGDGALPVCHFGMNGMLVLGGKQPEWYVRKPRAKNRNMDEWPPKYTKFALRLGSRESSSPGGSDDDPDEVEIAFLDSRRLGRIRLVPQPVKDHPPVSALGFDPVLSHPTLGDFSSLLTKRSRSTTKGLILDQSFAAGVGNWVADEALYAARIHPACPVGKLNEQEVERLWNALRDVCKTAVDVDARHKHFPRDWLFMHRWGKGKKGKRAGGGMILPDGRPATIDFCTVGGRTSAYVVEVQKLPEGVEYRAPVKRGKRKASADSSGSNSEESASSSSSSDANNDSAESDAEQQDSELSPKKEAASTRKSRVKVAASPNQPSSPPSPPPSKRPRRSAASAAASRVKKEEDEDFKPLSSPAKTKESNLRSNKAKVTVKKHEQDQDQEASTRSANRRRANTTSTTRNGQSLRRRSQARETTKDSNNNNSELSSLSDVE